MSLFDNPLLPMLTAGVLVLAYALVGCRWLRRQRPERGMIPTELQQQDSGDCPLVQRSTLELIDEICPGGHIRPRLLDVTQPDLAVMTLMADEGESYLGYGLWQSLLDLDLMFGEKGLFHRYIHHGGQRESLVSIASILDPGTFDAGNMGRFSTPGLILFMPLDRPWLNEAYFRDYLQLALDLQDELGGRLKDHARRSLSQGHLLAWRRRCQQREVV